MVSKSRRGNLITFIFRLFDSLPPPKILLNSSYLRETQSGDEPQRSLICSRLNLNFVRIFTCAFNIIKYTWANSTFSQFSNYFMNFKSQENSMWRHCWWISFFLLVCKKRFTFNNSKLEMTNCFFFFYFQRPLLFNLEQSQRVFVWRALNKLKIKIFKLHEALIDTIAY